ncbi:c-type cytochrome [Frateuria defendens]|uniref:c-type cytochrome n=1 Tax=Frateuria defendens TaxID=2219559 RepID=UPI0007DBF6CF|nr:cytochrome c [Frateuria defendens]
MKQATRYLVTAVATLAALALGLVLYAYSGLYGIGADDPHTRPVAALLETLRERAIHTRAAGIEVPNLDDPAMIAEGAEHYAAMCTGCHLAPGMSDSEIRPGLYPQPPNLAEHGVHDPREAFWVIKHGVKLSAMPAWGSSHDDATIWNMVAFIRKLPGMTPEQYQALAGEAGEGGHEHGHGHDHGAAHEHAGADHDQADQADHDHADHDSHDHAAHGDAPAPAASNAAPTPAATAPEAGHHHHHHDA